MNITTKFNIGDTVWTVKDNKAYSFEISKIEIIPGVVTSDSITVYHERGKPITAAEAHIFRGDDKYRYNESKIVGSREELINLL